MIAAAAPDSTCLLPSTLAGLDWPSNAGPPLRLPRRLACGRVAETRVDRLEQLKTRHEAILSGAFMYAAEVLTWIAFREPDHLAWQEDTKTYGRIGAALPDLSIPQGFELVRQVKQLVPLDTPELQIVARELAVERERRLKLAQATKLLLAEVGKETIVPYGRLDKWGAHEPHVRIPLEVFMDDTVTITLRDRVQQNPHICNGGINGGPGYRDVRFKTSDVLAIWARPSEQPSAKLALDTSQRRTGVAGRPSSKDLALTEMARRADRRELAGTLILEARQLCEWLKQVHTDQPQPTPKALSAQLKDLYWRLREKPKT